MASPLASLFTRIGFEVDKKSLNAFEGQLTNLENRIKGMAKSFQGVTGKSSTKLTSAQAKSARDNIYFEKQKEQYRQTEWKDTLKKAYFENKEISARRAFEKKVSDSTLKNTITNRQKQFQQEAAKVKELAQMGDYYRKLEAADKKKQAADTKYQNQESAKTLKNTITNRQKQFQQEAAKVKELANMGAYYRKLEAADKAAMQKQERASERASLMSQKSRQRILDFAHGQALREDYRRSLPTRAPTPPKPSRMGATGGSGADPLFTVGNLKTFMAFDALRRFTMQSYDVGNFQTAQQPQYEFLTGSAEGAQKQIKYVDNLVDKLKLNLQETNQQYMQFLGATKETIGVEKTQKTFEALQTFGVMMGATQDQLKRGTKAVQQMLSKQKLSA